MIVKKKMTIKENKEVMKRRKMKVKKVKMMEKIPRTLKRRRMKVVKKTVTKAMG